MKKLLLMFAVLDLFFVAMMLTIATDKERSIASSPQETELTDGQQQKLELIENLTLIRSSDRISLKTDSLQSLCASSDAVVLKFKALNIAFSGQEPLITHSFDCRDILKNKSQNSLSTTIENFKLLKTTPLIKEEFHELTSQGLYSDEEIPSDWKLFEISIIGKDGFNISEAEINKILGEEGFIFKLPIF